MDVGSDDGLDGLDGLDDLDDLDQTPGDEDRLREPPRRLTQLTQRGMSAHLLQRQLGGVPRPGRASWPTPTSDWRSETAGFHSSPADIHYTTSHDGNARCIPFCAAACNTNSLVAIGDEEGRVRLLDTAPSSSFDKIHLCFQAHNNAIIDLAFSSDDSRLATASGDQTGKVIDMMTQVPISVLGQHTASLKQVRFQPGRGEGHVLATSSRDGSIQIWDLRCHGGPVSDSITLERDAGLRYTAPRNITSGAAINSFFGAHEAMPRHQTRSLGLGANPLGTTTAAAVAAAAAAAAADHADVASRGEVPGRLSDVSVTAIHWLPAGREHLLLSACEADASIKLWDIRAIHTSRSHRTPTPVGYTAPPTSHTNWRHFGISSLSLSSDASRLYALCKDNTVYAYSTSHMVVGPPPDTTANPANNSTSFASTKKPKHAPAEQLPGPLYGFRHNNFHATSFYIKSALRPLRNARTELLAVGSADGSPVLFPTDERYFQGAIDAGTINGQQQDATFTTNTTTTTTNTKSTAKTIPTAVSGTRSRAGAHHSLLTTTTAALKRPSLTRTCSSSFSQGLRASIRDDIPIIRTVDDVTYGAPLVRGHGKEVGALTWSSEGSLVTVSDDYLIRCWREHDGGSQARDLRVRGEGEGRRWARGWADVQDGWDDD
ncbi:WD40-repeat-containing domain protein, partial [Coniella lustricola]